MSKFYVSKCPDTEQVFICQEGVDNNICEVFARDGQETAGDNAEFIVDRLNKEVLPSEVKQLAFDLWKDTRGNLPEDIRTLSEQYQMQMTNEQMNMIKCFEEARRFLDVREAVRKTWEEEQ